mmetsp:Transcript_51228/g.84082  ORF Transcript_51228/g.84082 Transcript_51228/m.84082 type:complete len:285 (-) Transcript_51228:622-1476(-)
MERICVCKLFEFPPQAFIVCHFLPFALFMASIALHHGLQVSSYAQRIINDNLLQVVNPTLQFSQPRGCALQMLGCGDVIHQESIDVLQALLDRTVRGQELGMCWLRSTIATHKEIVSSLRGNDAYVLPLGLSTLTQTSRSSHLDLVRRTKTFVAILQGHGHGNRILLAITAPARAHTALHRAQGLAIGLAGFHTSIHQLFENVRQIMDLRSIHAQSLSTGDLCPKAVLLGGGRKGNESVRGDVPSWAARDDRIGSSLLDVGQEPVVGVLNLISSLFQGMIVPQT